MSSFRFKGKTAVVTGASGGVGNAVARRLADLGTNLILIGRRADALEKLRSECPGVQSEIIALDLTKQEATGKIIAKAEGKFGSVDILVCSAGQYLRRRVLELKEDEARQIMEINFWSPVRLIRAVLPQMIQRRNGSIIVVSSVDAKKGLIPDSAYVASKFAVSGFMEVLRQELHGTGVHCGTIFPARIDTPMIGSLKVPLASPKLPPDRVARAIITMIRRREKHRIIPRLGPGTLIGINTISPSLGDFFARILKLEGSDQ